MRKGSARRPASSVIDMSESLAGCVELPAAATPRVCEMRLNDDSHADWPICHFGPPTLCLPTSAAKAALTSGSLACKRSLSRGLSHLENYYYTPFHHSDKLVVSIAARPLPNI